MLRWTIIFLVVAIIAAILGFGGIAAGAASIAKILFYIFLVLFVLSLIAGGFRRVDWCILSYMEVQLYCTFFVHYRNIFGDDHRLVGIKSPAVAGHST